ncbi:hypothetical protein D8Y22_16275 [Salinadaptatus halalkaliphilus]|uniref:Uncharacterized protein n=1 Tax=Salinadaptatus halalkaliphilus TaxID=2419781 RepID=A0A4S3TIM1_9EURY|nr:hypothetical protein [Salinadaptatus halalkaliphilus]THE63879.1 hypothetical protein D8Y22_16275 [Salinadaptatus halalkaliphilus]
MVRTLVVLDLVLAAVTLAALVVVAVTAGAFGLGYGLVTVKHVLFAVGLLLAGVGTLQYRTGLEVRDGSDASAGHPSSPSRSVDPTRRSRLRSLLEACLPDGWIVPPGERLPDAAKIAVVGLALLVVSYGLEAVFGVGV